MRANSPIYTAFSRLLLCFLYPPRHLYKSFGDTLEGSFSLHILFTSGGYIKAAKKVMLATPLVTLHCTVNYTVKNTRLKYLNTGTVPISVD